MNGLARGIPALVISIASAGLSFMWIKVGFWPVLFLFAYIVLAGLMLDTLGRIHFLPKMPVRAMRLMEFWFLLPGATTALVIAVIALAGKHFWKTDTLDPSIKEALLISGAGLTAFLGIFMKLAEEADKNWMAPHIRDSFRASFKRKEGDESAAPGIYFIEASSELERWIYSDVFKDANGWEFSDRYKRAKGIAECLPK